MRQLAAAHQVTATASGAAHEAAALLPRRQVEYAGFPIEHSDEQVWGFRPGGQEALCCESLSSSYFCWFRFRGCVLSACWLAGWLPCLLAEQVLAELVWLHDPNLVPTSCTYSLHGTVAGQHGTPGRAARVDECAVAADQRPDRQRGAAHAARADVSAAQRSLQRPCSGRPCFACMSPVLRDGCFTPRVNRLSCRLEASTSLELMMSSFREMLGEMREVRSVLLGSG